MRIILDTDKKTITVPHNYQKKLNEMNELIVQLTGDESKKKTFSGYIDEIWRDCIANSDSRLKTANKPNKTSKEKEE